VNNYQQQILKQQVTEKISSAIATTDGVIWTLIWDIVDPSIYQSDEIRKYARTLLGQLLGTSMTVDILALMEGATIQPKPDATTEGF
jgi:hypothetical protein